MSSKLTVWLEAVSLLAPGIPDWESGRAILSGQRPYEPAPTVLPVSELLPAAERRRATKPVKLCLALGEQACAAGQYQPSDLASVFCSSGADGQTTHAICDALSTSERMVSPTRFHNSVHNAAAGYWGIAAQSMMPSQVICAHDATFAAGLLEAAVQAQSRQAPVLLMAYDGDYPEPLSSARPIPDIGGIAMVVSPMQRTQSMAALDIQIESVPRVDTDYTKITPKPLAGGIGKLDLESLPELIPALAGLSLLKCLVQPSATPVNLPYLSGMRLQVSVSPSA